MVGSRRIVGQKESERNIAVEYACGKTVEFEFIPLTR
jgi:hypothetical protein